MGRAVGTGLAVDPPSHILGPEQLQDYRRDGYVLLEKFISEDLIERHNRKCDEIITKFEASKEIGWVGAASNPFKEAMTALDEHDGDARALHDHPDIRGAMSGLGIVEPILHQTRTHIWDLGTRTHSDTVMLFRDPPDQVSRAWCALEDIHPDSGLFYILSGSHRGLRQQLYELILDDQIREFLSIPLDADPTTFKQASEAVWNRSLDVIEEVTRDMPKHCFELKRGDVLFFDPNTIHGTLKANDSQRSRRAIISEWRGAAVRAYPAVAYFGETHDRRAAFKMLDART